MTDVSELLTTWQGPDGARPRLTWYGPAGERVELSGRVLANWVIKAANLLGAEADAGPDTEVLIDLPPHWRALVWSLGGWLTGAQVDHGQRLRAGRERPGEAPTSTYDVVVTDLPEAAPQGEVLIAVALPAMAMAFTEELPAEAIDGAADLMTYPDELVLPPEPVDLDEVAGPTWTGPSRVLAPTTTAALVPQVLSIWRGGSSVVLVDDPDADLAHLAKLEGAELIEEER